MSDDQAAKAAAAERAVRAWRNMEKEWKGKWDLDGDVEAGCGVEHGDFTAVALVSLDEASEICRTQACAHIATDEGAFSVARARRCANRSWRTWHTAERAGPARMASAAPGVDAFTMYAG